MWSKINSRIGSIQLRLTLWYAIILGATLLVYGSFLFYTLQNSLIAEAKQFVSTTAREDKFIIENRISSNQLNSLEQTDAKSLLDRLASGNLFLVFRDQNGRISSRSSLPDRDLSIPKRVDAQEIPDNRSKTTFISNNQGRVLLYDLPLKKGSKTVGILEVGQSLQSIDSTLDKLVYFLLFGGGAIFLLAGIGGHLLATFALSPIDRIAVAANRIGKGDFDQHIDIRNRADQIGQLAATFNKMTDRLGSLLKMKTQFVADASHELRTPLTVLKGNVNMLQRWGMNDPKVCGETLAIIDREAQRMTRIVSDLLILAQEDAGVPSKHEQVQLDQILLQTFKKAEILANDLTVHLQHNEKAVVLGDSDRLKQMLLIFIDNAVKYTPSGGEIYLSLRTTDSQAKISVEDTGIGISKDDLPNIYKRFFRAGRPHLDPQSGAGLGLSIAKRIVEAHKGHIEVKSQVEQGTGFDILLPLAKNL
jgi:two-component system OmpR family sensor kinase